MTMFVSFTADKRRTYDQFGKRGLEHSMGKAYVHVYVDCVYDVTI